jgi:hypothetical protein
MRILKYRAFILESVITPSDEAVNLVGDIIKSGKWSDLDELNNLLYPHVRIMDVNEFRESLETDLEKDGVPMNAPLFAAYHTKLKIPVILYNMDEARLLSGIRTPEMVKKIEMMLDHEIVHQEQDIRSGSRAYSLERSPKYDTEKYFSHYSEIMAYARTLARELNNAGFTKEKSIDLIRRGKISHWIWETYKGIGGSVFVGFKKKLIEYLERPQEEIYESVGVASEKIKDVLIKRIPFLKEYNIFESERNPEELHAQKISYYEGIKRVIGEEIYEFPGYNSSSEVFYSQHKVYDNVFHYFVIKNRFYTSKPENMSDLMHRVFIMVKKRIEENFSYRKEIMLKEGNEIPYDVLDVIINEMNKNLFEFEEFTEKENVPLF